MAVGCIITLYRDDGIVSSSFGYNHGNCTGAQGHCGCTHAEVMAIDSVIAKQSQYLTIESTHSPCMACAMLLLQLADSCDAHLLLYYHDKYRDESGINLIRQTHGCYAMHVTDHKFED